MSDVPPEQIDRMMVKCSRRCCICRRFRPTRLQVHHIVERSHGGSDDEDNLIVTCLSCHSDLHTKVPFARRFSTEELKGHRDAVIKMVADGNFPLDDMDHTDQIIRALVQEFRIQPRSQIQLLPEAVELLLAAVKVKDSAQGSIMAIKSFEGLNIIVGGGEHLIDIKDQRAAKKYEHAIKELLKANLLELESEQNYEVNYEGYLAADEIFALGSQALDP